MATRVFAERGWTATDVQEVANRLGIGKGTIYRYFPTKERLFLSAADWGMSQLRAAVEQAAAHAAKPLERISLAIRAYLEFFDAHPELIELLIQERAHFRDRGQPTYFQHRDADVEPWRALVRGLIRAGEIRPVPVDRIVDVLSDLVYGTMFTTYFAGRRKSLARQCEDILDIVFHGILTKSEQPRHAARRSVR